MWLKVKIILYDMLCFGYQYHLRLGLFKKYCLIRKKGKNTHNVCLDFLFLTLYWRSLIAYVEMAFQISSPQTDDFQDDTLEIAGLHAHLAAMAWARRAQHCHGPETLGPQIWPASY